MKPSAYIFNQLERSIGEGTRLSIQAQAFVELELPALLSKISADAHVGDFGCGTGVISSALAMHLPGGKVTGLDPDDRALERAKANGQGLANLSFEKYGFGDGQLPQAGPFDVAFCRLVLLHLADPRAAIAQMGSCLKPGGLLYLVDCDDDYDYFSPSQPWQGELVALMKQAQEIRGGSRTLGSKLPLICREGGFLPEGSSLLYYSTENLGQELWKKMFVPEGGGMAARDFELLLEKGLLGAADMQQMQGSLSDFFNRQGGLAALATWHSWARKN